MQSTTEILADIWTSAGGDPAALNAVRLSGDEAQLPSSFRVATAAGVSVAATGLAAAESLKMRSDQSQDVAVDMRHAEVERRSMADLRGTYHLPPTACGASAGDRNDYHAMLC